MACILGHGAEKGGIEMDNGGYVLISDLIKFGPIAELNISE
jgi:RNA:NAD 2'-phosphotransferase (TPT1/KptA family)